MPRIEQEYLVATCGLYPERVNLIRHFYSLFDYHTAGINRHIVNVEPIYYQGVSAGTEFLTYAATKLYLCFDIYFGNQPGGANQAAYVNFYNEANAANGLFGNVSAYYEPVAAVPRYSPNYMIIKNCYFSRFVLYTYTNIKFNGYRITLD